MKKIYASLLGICAVLSLVVAVVYFSKTAGALPHFFPGYSLGSSHKHTKHAIVFIGLAVVFVLGAWMLSGPEAPASATKNDAA